MKVGDLVEWTVDGDVGVIVDVCLDAPIDEIQVYWSNGESEWLWADQDGLKVLS